MIYADAEPDIAAETVNGSPIERRAQGQWISGKDCAARRRFDQLGGILSGQS
jgi:hypothetical protein